MTHDADRSPTTDEEQGIAWWNSQSEAKRLLWLQLAGGAAAGASAASAWAAFKQAKAQPKAAERPVDAAGDVHPGDGER